MNRMLHMTEAQFCLLQAAFAIGSAFGCQAAYHMSNMEEYANTVADMAPPISITKEQNRKAVLSCITAMFAHPEIMCELHSIFEEAESE